MDRGGERETKLSKIVTITHKIHKGAKIDDRKR